MKVATAISQLVTSLEALSWTSDDGSGTTSYQEVFDYQNYLNTLGNPFVCVWDRSGVGEGLTIVDIQMNTEIVVDICCDWSIVGGASDSEKARRAEANLRLREAWDYTKGRLFDTNFIAEPDLTIEPQYQKLELVEINIYLYRVTFNLMEIINRG